MKGIIDSIELLKGGHVGRTVRQRMGEFKAKGASGEDALFSELCFCLLTANYTSEGGIRIQEAVGQGFMALRPSALAARLRGLGYRFPNARARYIVEARKHHGTLGPALSCGKSDPELRDDLASGVLGLGLKESSHFLRNVGRSGVAIIDFHIIDLLAREGLIERPEGRSLTRRRYLEIEGVLGRLSSGAGVSQGELDLYLWYMETGKILK